METGRLLRTRRVRKRKPKLIFFLFFVAIACFATIFAYWEQYYPNPHHAVPDFGGLEKPVFHNGMMLEESAAGERESLKLPFSIVKKYIDPHIIYEEQSESVIITTRDKVLRMNTDKLTGMINEKPFQLHFPVEKAGGQIFLPVQPLLSLYQIELRESETSGAVILVKAGDRIQWGVTATFPNKPERTVPMRAEPSVKAPILADLRQEEQVMILSDEQDWYKVQQDTGVVGYVRKKWLTPGRLEIVPHNEPDPLPLWKPENKIHLTWEQVTSRHPDTEQIGEMPGVNVVSPTWFELQDGNGNIKNKASAGYAEWARERNYQLWPLFSNGFEPERTSEALSTYEKRMNMIKQLLGFAQAYRFQGINIDFENVYLKDKDNLVQFVRELVPIMHEQGLVVSIDVTPKSSSEMWSLFYDRPALAEAVDYMIVMAYDEHWAGSPVAGSVSSLPWAENAIVRILEEDKVPAGKLVLGLPFYTRIWTEEVVDGTKKVSSRAVYMDTVKRIIKENNLTPVFQPETGQNYVEYREGDKLHKIWIEDEVSMKARMELVDKYGLAGVASWRRGYESPEIWELIRQSLQ